MLRKVLFSCVLIHSLFFQIDSGRLANAQVNQEWVATYNGPGDDIDHAWAMALDGAGNIYITGYSRGVGTLNDYATIKYSSTGVQQWVARYNGPGNFTDNAWAIAVDNAGNVYVTGNSDGNGTGPDIATIKYNSAGVEQWVARYNGPGTTYLVDTGSDIAVDDAGNVYVTGSSSANFGDYVTIKYNTAGVTQWVALYGALGGGSDGATALALDAAGNVYVTGGSYGGAPKGNDFATIKYSNAGVQQWVARYEGTGSIFDDSGSDVVVDGAGNVYVTGRSDPSPNVAGLATVKYSAAGVELWDARDGGGISRRSLAVDNGGNVYVTYRDLAANLKFDYKTFKFSPNGVVQWAATYNGPGNDHDEAFAVSLDGAGNVYVTGHAWGSGTWYDITTVKYSAAGAQQWVAIFNGSANTNDESTVNFVDGAGNVYVTGSLEAGAARNMDMVTIKYSQTGQTNQPPVAVASASPQSGTAPLTVNFNSAGSNDPDGAITGYSWNFGDSNSSTLPNPTHTYSNAGTYNATLTVTDNQGATGSDVEVITVNSPACSNIALGKTATASSSNGSNTPNLAVDGNASTFWRSSSGGTQYLQVDLGAGTINYSEATIKWRGTRFAKKFHLRVSNNANFTTFSTVFSTTSGTGGNQTVSLSGAPRTERYIRLHMTQVNSSYYAVNEFEVCGSSASALSKPTTVDPILPEEIELYQNHPNPFNPSTSISFSLPNEARVTLKIFNAIGAEVATLVNEVLGAGVHAVDFNATNLPSGVYFSVMQVGEVRQVRRLVLMK